MKKLITSISILFLISILFSILVLAMSEYEIGTTNNISFIVENRLGYLTTTADCNISIWFANGTIDVNYEQILANSNGWYEREINYSDLGIHKALSNCSETGFHGLLDLSFKVITPISVNTTTLENMIISTNDTVKNSLENTTSQLTNLDTSLSNNFTSTNNLINNVNSSIISAINNIPSLVWSYSTRTLTSFDFLVNLAQLTIDWIYGNFTYMNNLITNVNQTLPENIWIYPNRTVQNVTYVTNVENVTNVMNVTDMSEDLKDDIATRVIQYFFAVKDKLLIFRLW